MGSMPETAPVLFNALKHHLGYLQQTIRETSPSLPDHELRQLLLPIGAAQLDFYTGSLSIGSLTYELKQFLRQQGIESEKAYTEWLQSHQDYRLFTASDTSGWVLRLGHHPGQWVHLHPARYAPYTLRLKAQSLKTAVALAIRHAHSPDLPIDLDRVNQLRQVLHLPPLADRHLHPGLQEIYILLLAIPI